MAKNDKASNKPKIPLMRKITAKNVMGVPVKNVAKLFEDGSVVELFSIAGVVTRCRAVSTQFGDSVGFKGQFYAQRHAIKEAKIEAAEFTGGEFFAPGNLEDDILNAWQTRAEGVNSVQFGAKISIQCDENAQTGYVFVAEPLIDTAPSDALANVVREAFGKLPLALEAPKG